MEDDRIERLEQDLLGARTRRAALESGRCSDEELRAARADEGRALAAWQHAVLNRTRFYIWEGAEVAHNRLVKVVGGLAWVLLDGQWHESAHAWRRVQGIGGDADTHEVSEQEALAFMREARPA